MLQYSKPSGCYTAYRTHLLSSNRNSFRSSLLTSHLACAFSAFGKKLSRYWQMQTLGVSGCVVRGASWTVSTRPEPKRLTTKVTKIIGLPISSASPSGRSKLKNGFSVMTAVEIFSLSSIDLLKARRTEREQSITCRSQTDKIAQIAERRTPTVPSVRLLREIEEVILYSCP